VFIRSPVSPKVVVFDVLDLPGDTVSAVLGHFVLQHLGNHACGVGLNGLQHFAAARENSAVLSLDGGYFDVIVVASGKYVGAGDGVFEHFLPHLVARGAEEVGKASVVPLSFVLGDGTSQRDQLFTFLAMVEAVV